MYGKPRLPLRNAQKNGLSPTGGWPLDRKGGETRQSFGVKKRRRHGVGERKRNKIKSVAGEG